MLTDSAKRRRGCAIASREVLPEQGQALEVGAGSGAVSQEIALSGLALKTQVRMPANNLMLALIL